MPTMAASGPGNLPAEVTSFVGRRQELAQVRRAFTSSTLVTLIGPGGVGKTRLAARAGATMARSFTDGVWLVELGELEGPGLVLQAVTDALGLRQQAAPLTEEALRAFLSDRVLLLILDSCEHLVEEVGPLVDAVRRTSPDVHILATSRTPLGIEGEVVLRVDPLPAPDPDRPPSLKELAEVDSVSLFHDRAVAVEPRFALDEANRRAVVQIAHQLDGVPLALELAAARLRAMSPQQLADGLADRYRLLTGGSPLIPTRHQTLRTCVDWSYEQCSPLEQTLWSRCSVFVGGFDLDAVEGVCAFGGVERLEVLDLLGALVDKSVVTRVDAGDRARYRLLESLREYGLERLRESGEHDEMVVRHRTWYAGLAVRARQEWVGPEQATWTRRLDNELPNLRVAFEHRAAEPTDPGLALRLSSALHLYWLSRGLLSEGRRWLDSALAEDESGSTPPRVQALCGAVILAGMQGDLATAGERLTECQAAAAEVGDDAVSGLAAHAAGMHALFVGDGPTAVDCLQAAVDSFRTHDDPPRLVESLIGLSLAAGSTGDTAAAIGCHEELLALTERRGEIWARAYSLWSHALVAWREGDVVSARSTLEQSLRLQQSVEDQLGSVWSLEAMALVEMSAGDAERAAVLLGASTSLTRDFSTQAATFPHLVPAYAECEAAARAALGEKRFDSARRRGAELDHQSAVAFALREQRDATGSAQQLLTPREREVAELIAEGLTNKGIAARLVISQRTVQGHVENILSKLGFSSRTQVAAWMADRSQAG